jgi:hypothetical protein
MRSLSIRLFAGLLLLVTPVALSAANVTISGSTTFAALDGSADDEDHAVNGVFTVSGDLTVNGAINCNDTGGSSSACAMSFHVGHDLVVNAGGALYAENRSGTGTGGAITVLVGHDFVMHSAAGSSAAGIISSNAKNSSSSTGGNITANVGGAVSIESGATIDAGATNATGGKIQLSAGGHVDVDGNVLSGPSRTILSTRLTGLALDGGTSNQSGGEIRIQSTTFIEPALNIGSNANILSQGDKSGSGPVTIEGCGVVIKGLVAALATKDSPARLVVRSGKTIVIDSRDLGVTGATTGRLGHLRGDAPTGAADQHHVDVFAAGRIDILGPVSSTLYAISGLPGLSDSKSDGAVIRVTSLGDVVAASGNVIDDGRNNSGDGGGNVTISASGNIAMDTARIRAVGDSNTNNTNRNGGSITIRSYSGNIVWTNGLGDVTPAGTAIAQAKSGTLTFSACGTINTSGTSFPTSGSAYPPFPASTTGACSPAAPSLPVGEPVLPTCNTPPTANSQSVTTLEDNSVTITMTASDPDNQPLTFSIVSPPAHGTLGPIMNATATSAQVVYTPNADYNGSDSFTFMVNDGNGGTATGIVSITVTAVNDAPSFNAGASPQTSSEDGGGQFVSPWASGISAGPADESTQHVTFTITSNSNPSLFSAGPSVSPSGALSYTAAPNANGTATLTVVAHDDGGTANGGVDTSAPQTFTINITAVNDAPSFTKGADQTSLEDGGPQSVAGWATAISAGPADESGQTVSFNVTGNSNPSLFSAGPAVAADGTLTYTAAPNANGSATISVAAHDNGGTAGGGVDTSASQSFTITVTPVNDAPSFTKGADQSALEDSGAHTVAGWATAISAGPADESAQTVTFTATNDNNALFSVQPSVASNGTLTYATAADAYGTATVTVTAHDDGGTANGGADTSAAQTFTITLTPVNDAPSFTKGGDVTTLEDAAAYSQAGWATGISAGPNEGSQTVNFIVSNNNAALFSVQPSVSGSGTLSFLLAPNANGTATVTVAAHDDGGTANGGADTSAPQTFTITAIPVNDAPSFTKGADQSVFEDSGATTVGGWATAISAGPADEAGQSVSFNVSNNNSALFAVQPSVAPNGTLTFTPATNAVGSATVTLSISDNGGTANGGVDTSAAQTFTITVNGVNDAPSFTKGADQTSLEDGGAQTVAGWATAISAGPADESSQSVTFTATNDNNALFSVQPAIAADGTLTYTAATNAYGTAIVTVTAHDDGGTANGGVDTSAPQTFSITIVAVNDAPSFTKGADVTALEDSGAYSQSGWATALSDGPNESGQALTFTVSNDNNALFSVQPAVASDGTLTFTTAANAYGTATVTVTLQDDGGTANGGADTSASQTFVISLTPVNDAPSFTKGADQTSSEDGGAQTVAGWATAISAGPSEGSQSVDFVVTNDNNALFSVQPAVSPSGTLSYTAAPNANGTATVTVAIHDDGGTANGGVDTSATQTFTITISPVNDAPSFTKGADQSSLEDGGAQTVAAWATAISAGPADESGQTVTFTTTNDNNALFSVQPSVAADGTLTYTAAPDAFGTATVTVTAHDDGGTANGGVDTSAPQTFTITITPVNDAPSFTKGPDVALLSDAGPQSYPNWATAISAGPANESAQVVNFIVTNDNNAVFTSQPVITSSGTLTFTTAVSAPTTTVHVTVVAHDNGGTANGGVDSSAPQTFNVNVTHANQPPVASDDSYDAVGNTELAVGTTGAQAATLVTSGSVLANDSDPDGDPLTVTLGAVAGGATVTMNPDGSFRFLPAAGFTGNVTFTYNVSDGAHITLGTVTIHVNKRVLYVKNNAGAGGSGRVDAPYNTLATAAAAAVDNDALYVFTGDGTTSNQNAGVTLSHNGERLIGEGVALTASGIYNSVSNPALRAAGTRPKIGNSAGNGVTVTGVGTISNLEVSGVEVSSATINGVLINNVAGMTMDGDRIAAATRSGVRGTTVNGFTFTNGDVGTSGSLAGDGNISFDALTGSATVSNSSLAGGFNDNLRVVNTGGVLNRLTITNVNFNGNNTASGNNAAQLSGTTGTFNVTATGNHFNATRAQHFQLSLGGVVTSDLVFTGNTISNSQIALSGGGGVLVTSGGTSVPTLSYNISNNSIRDAVGTAINVTKGAGTGSANGTISNNNIGLVGVLNSGSQQGSGIAINHIGGGTSFATVTGNQIFQYNNTGITVQVGDKTTGSGSVVAIVTGNTIAAPGLFASNGFLLNAGTTTGDAHQVCLTLGGAGAAANSLTGSAVVANGSTDIRLRQRMATTVRLAGYVGANNDNSAVQSYVQSNNGLTPTASAANSVPTGGGFVGGVCP